MTLQRASRLTPGWFALAIIAVGAIGGSLTACANSHKKTAMDPPPGNRIFSPSWYEETPDSENGQLRTTAQAVGATVTMSENMAINQARQRMALTIESRVDVLQRSFQEQVALADDPELLNRFQNVNTIVASRVLRGARVVSKETYPANDGRAYRTFALIELDGHAIDAQYLNRLKNEKSLETRLRSTEAWKELERRARLLRQERNSGNLPPMTDKELSGG